MTTSSSGFEAYFDAEMVLVIAVSIKKERLSLKVTDCHVADGCWVRQAVIVLFWSLLHKTRVHVSSSLLFLAPFWFLS